MVTGWDLEFDSQEKVAFISDVHGNLEALDAVLDRVKGLPTFCLGDIVGYGASPNEVVRRLMEVGVKSLLGNHDNAALTGDLSMFNPRAAMGAVWTRNHLNRDSREFLSHLRPEATLKASGNRIFAAHGSPDDPLWEYVYPNSHGDLFGHYLKKLGVDVCAFGHTHEPFAESVEEGLVFNPGSVGQPRDGNWKASFAVLARKDGKATVEIGRVSYDVEAAAARIRSAGLPVQFADRLARGL